MSLPLRPLPIAFGPLHRETIGSYLNRLAYANRLHINILTMLILGRKWPCQHYDTYCRYWTPDAYHRLSELSNRSSKALGHALPAIQPNANHQPGTLPLDGRPRPICRSCAARRGWRGMAMRRSHSHEDRCTRHHRWVARTREYDLHLLPWTRQAHRRHCQLAQRFRPSTVDRAYLTAMREKVPQLGSGRARMEPALRSRLDALGEDPYGDPQQPSSERLELITYPEVIAQIAHTLHRWPPKPDAQENAINNEKHRPEFSLNLSRRSSHTSPTDMIDEKSSIDVSA